MSKLEKLESVSDLGLLFSAIKAEMVSSIDQELASFELTAAQYRVVMILSDNGQTTLANLCENMDCDRGAMSRLLCRLEKKGLINKHPSTEDKRSVYLRLSDKGRAFLPNILPKVDAVFNNALKNFSQEERKLLRGLLLRFFDGLKQDRMDIEEI